MLSRWAVEALIHRTGRFRGKPRLLRLFGRFCVGAPVRSPLGVYMEAHLDDSTNRFALTGAYEPILAHEIAQMDVSSAFIDVGANQGAFTLLAAKRVGAGGRVLAFEPQPQMGRLLRRNIALNLLQNVLVFDVALGSRTGMARMSVPEGHSGLAHLSSEGDTTVFTLNPADFLPALREWVGCRPVTIKVDVEGGEIEVLESLRPVFDCLDVKTCLVEVDQDHLSRAGRSEDELYQLMDAYGFAPFFGRRHAPHFDEVFRRVPAASRATPVTSASTIHRADK